MSKLKELFEGSQYARLNTLPGGSKNFSVRKQSNIEQNIRQENAVDFFGNTYQDGFDVNKPSLSAAGFRKALGAQTSDFTGEVSGPAAPAASGSNAFDSYNRFANDAFRNTYNSKLVHRFLATDSTKQYKTQQETSAGVVLTYNV
jgi:hypothetical protein